MVERLIRDISKTSAPKRNPSKAAKSNWDGLMHAADIGTLDLDAIAYETGYKNGHNLDLSFSPRTIAREREMPSGSARFRKFAKAIRDNSVKLAKASDAVIASALLSDPKRNPSKAAKLASLDRRIKAAEEAGIPPHYLMEQRDLLAKKAKRNPAGKASPLKGTRLPEAHARHVAEGLLGRMHADGADTFAKKVKWVKKHMPQIDRPRTFVGWVTKGERGRVVYKAAPRAR